LKNSGSKLLEGITSAQGLGNILSTAIEGYTGYRGLEAIREGVDAAGNKIENYANKGFGYLDPYANADPTQDPYMKAILGDIRNQTGAEFAKQGLAKSGAMAQAVADRSMARAYLPYRQQSLGAAQGAASLAQNTGAALGSLEGAAANATANWWQGLGQNASGTVQQAAQPTFQQQATQAANFMKSLQNLFA
jgi:hypothetical protein